MSQKFYRRYRTPRAAGPFTILLQVVNYLRRTPRLFSGEMKRRTIARTSPVEVTDPLCATVGLPSKGEYYPHGFPVSVASNSPAVLAAAERSWAGLHRRYEERPVEVRCLVSPGAGRKCPPPPVVRAQANLLTGVADRENFTCVDLEKGFAFAWVTEAVVENTDYFRYYFLESMAMCLLDTAHLVAVHAACIALDGHGVLLAGDSGAGKSSLAYACARRGWTYTSDDATSLVRRDAGRTVLGNPRLFRFRGTAGELFPEFSGMRESRRGEGKPTIEVSTEVLPAIRTASDAQVDFIVFLNRRDAVKGRVELRPVPRQEALARLYTGPWPPELKSRADQRAAIERLLDAELVELRYRELDAAVGALAQIVRGGSR
jgi:hypothetical protein